MRWILILIVFYQATVFADQLEDFGPEGLSKDKLIRSGFKAESEKNGKIILTKGANNKVVSSRGEFLAYKINSGDEGELVHVDLNASGQALSRTRCMLYAKKYYCSSVTNLYCTDLLKKLGPMGKGLQACSEMLGEISIDRTGNRAEFDKATGIFKQELGESATNLQYPSLRISLNAIVQDYAQCDLLNGGVMSSSLWAPTKGNESTLEPLPSTYPKATQ